MERSDEEEDQDCTKSMPEKIFITLIVFIITICVIIFICIVGIVTQIQTDCQTINCIKSSAQLLQSIDFPSNPCDDFYIFTCRGGGGDGDDSNAAVLSPPIDKPPNETEYNKRELITYDETARQFYVACSSMDQNYTELQELLEEIGGWPLLLGQQWLNQQFNWMDFTIRLRELNLPSNWLLKIDLIALDHNGPGAIKITIPTIIANNNLNDAKYFEIVKDIIVEQLGASRQIASTELKKIRDFENELLAISVLTRSLVFSEKVRTLGQLGSTWKDLMQKYYYTHNNNVTLNDSTLVITVMDVQYYLIKLNQLLIRTPKRTQANFFVWKVLEYFLPYNDQSIRLHKNLNSEDYFSHCVEETYKRFKTNLDQVYVKHELENKNLDQINQMIIYIKNQLITTLRNTLWISAKLKLYAREQIESLQIVIGAPQLFKNEVFHFNTSDNFIAIIRKEYRFNEDKSFTMAFINNGNSSSNEDDIRDREYMKAALGRKIYFNWNENVMILPVYFVQDFWYDSNRPNYLNYASLGSRIAYELSHEIGQKMLINFVDQHQKASEIIGELRANNNYISDSLDEIMHDENIIVADYDKILERLQTFLINKTTLNETDRNKIQKLLNDSTISPRKIFTHILNYNEALNKTLDEHFADIFGINVAYLGYEEWIRNNSVELKLPGLDFTPNQLFWIQSTYLSCTDVGDDQIARVMDRLKNSQYFARSFNCSIDSQMNRVNRFIQDYIN